ncbi:hypothetical protein [Mycobacteroides franklinii]|uniref:hypothetical protein n=1 Tax=Mycobacteroides franklinii TaxID=948102 RepID=UPI0009936BFE|nr:hypothetical protein [Mycobacteroides franklinii]
MSALSDLLNDTSVSARQAADRAAEEGIDLPYGTLAGYWAGNHGRPSAASLKKLAQVVPVPEQKLQQAAWSTTAPLGPYTPPEEAMHLDHRQRRAVDELIKSIVATRGDGHDDQPGVPNESTAPAGTSREADKGQEDKRGSVTRARLKRR